MAREGPLRRSARGPWAIPLASAALIAFAFLVRGRSTALFDAGLVAATLVAGRPIAVRAVRDLRIRRIGIEALVTIAVTGAFVIGELWEGAAVTFLFALGGALERAAVGRTRNALARLFELAPETATVRRDGEEVVVSPSEVRRGEIVVVRPGGKIPVDGEVVAGRAAVDESSITGESMPVEASAGRTVYAGTVTAGGLIEVRATGVGADTALARIIHRVEEAQESKAPAQRAIERFAAWYTPAIAVLAAVTFALTRQVELALTLLVIACPGALVISMPVSMVAGIGRAARDGVLVKGGEHLELVGKVTAVAFDKTGTLTVGAPRLVDVVPVEGAAERDVLAVAAAAESGSEHPLAAPILAAAAAQGIVPSVDHGAFVHHAGAGVETTFEGRTVAVGTTSLAAELGVEVDAVVLDRLEQLRLAGRTSMVVIDDGTIVGVLGLADEVRADAAAGIERLRDIGVEEIVMLTGDSQLVGDAVGRAVGIDRVRGDLSPEDKLAAIRELQQRGHVVAMIGDGVNDAPALATADVGIAFGGGATAVAVETADVGILSGHLARVATAIDLSRRTARVVRQNVAIALFTVTSLLVGVLLGEVMMAAGMLVHQVSVVAVVLNAVRLLRGGSEPAPLPADLGPTATEPVRGQASPVAR
ncbi:heavy metal translocating P-type ATPase [Actinomarinicola tropica]|uniref:Heavy metal translocating P-type ATPase n=1 Tax=Actinomarinicola tropica TaxID=2789776 RepID=A0A5Q2RS29_9ACTN|nr:heavy metal translocating P-type ATPase [Actinomarinicola tropica]